MGHRGGRDGEPQEHKCFLCQLVVDQARDREPRALRFPGGTKMRRGNTFEGSPGRAG